MVSDSAMAPKVWPVGALCRAIADALESRFNPVAVAGEISGYTRAASGHCYFSLKDASGQLRCAMFRRAAGLLDFSPTDGDRVEVRGRLGVYEPRGELQLIVESLSRAGQGSLFEQFLQLKAKLEALGLFDTSRKRAVPSMPRGIGVVTSLGAAALHDVITALQRRVPHIPVVIAPASVQGEGASRDMMKALEQLYGLAQGHARVGAVEHPVDVILLVRGGGSMEDLWSFNNEQLAHVIASSPVPIISGVGHETDFTIADFVADLRAPTPTAAAELVSASTQEWLNTLQDSEARLRKSMRHFLEREAQQVDHLAVRAGRPSGALAHQRARLGSVQQHILHALGNDLQRRRNSFAMSQFNFAGATQQNLRQRREAWARTELRLGALNPALVLQRGYAWLTQEGGKPVTQVGQVHTGQSLQATLVDGTVDLEVRDAHRN